MGNTGKKQSTQDALHGAILKATHFMEQNLERQPSVRELAGQAGLSSFHFQRVFREIVGESVNQHCVRLRIERAAYFLKFSAWHIQDIALAAGFESQASFTRTFHRIYGMSPKAFRENECVAPYLRAHIRSRNVTVKSELPYVAPTVLIDDWPALETVALRYYGPVSGIYDPWRKLIEWVRQKKIGQQSLRFFGLWFDDWRTGDDPNYRYECTVLLPPDSTLAIDAPFFKRTIPSGKVAVSTVYGTPSQLDRSWRGFAHGWLPFSGYQPRLDYMFDEYPAKLLLAPDLVKAVRGLYPLRMSMHIPITAETVSI